MSPVQTISLPLQETNLQEIRRYAKCPEGAVNEISECIDELRPLSGKVCYCECDLRRTGDSLDLEFAKTDSKALGKALSHCDKILLFCATIGLLPDRLLAKYSRISPVKALLLQAVATERIEALCDEFCLQMAEEYRKHDCSLSSRFSPGYGDLPLTLQRDIFSVLDCPRRIGVTLGSNLLMMPSKSVTAIIGIMQNKQETIS